MIPELSDDEIEKAGLLKTYRAAVRLKYSLRADEEIKRNLPDVEKAIDNALSGGAPFELDFRSILEGKRYIPKIRYLLSGGRR